MHQSFVPILNAHLSKVAFGSVKLGRNSGVKYPHAFDLPSDAQVVSLLACVCDLGINVIDTAPAYGTAESRLGALLTNRHDWFLFSKAGETFDGGQSHFDFSYQAIRHSIETSLQRLRSDYLDGVLLHSDGNDMEIMQTQDGSLSEAVGALQDAKQAGQVRTIGISSKTPVGALHALSWADCVMLEYNNRLDTHAQKQQKEVCAQAQQQGVAVIVKKALSSGHAAQQTQGVEQALRFVLQQPISSIVLGSLSQSHWRQNVACVNKLLASADVRE